MNKAEAKKELEAIKNREKELIKIIKAPEPKAPKSIMDRVKSYEDSCKILKLKTALPDVSMYDSKDRAHAIADFKLIRITRALNEGWKPNWKDGNQKKWYCWFNMPSSPSGFSFSNSICDWASSSATVGSRLCFPTQELAEYFGRTFIGLHEDHLLL